MPWGAGLRGWEGCVCVSWGVGVVPYERVLEPLYSNVAPHRIGGEDGSPPMLT